MGTDTPITPDDVHDDGRLWPVPRRGLGRAAVFGIVIAAATILYVTDRVQTRRELDAILTEAADRVEARRDALIGDIERAAPLPALFAAEPVLSDAFAPGARGALGRAAADRWLAETGARGGVRALFLVDADGRVIAGHADAVPFAEWGRPLEGGRPALERAPATFLSDRGGEEGHELIVTHPMTALAGVAGLPRPGGALVARIGLAGLGTTDGPLLLTDASGQILASGIAGLRPGDTVPEGWTRHGARVSIARRDHVAAQAELGFLGLRLTGFAPAEPAYAAVRAVLATEIMAMAVAAALVLLVSARRQRRTIDELRQESDTLRELNARLADEIEERARVESELRTAQDGLAQASRLAALGQMSAAVSHELSQPLAAMKTYLAGSRLLLGRARTEEALENLGRSDALLDRMVALTRELRSFARKGGPSLQPVDLAEAARGALSVMSAQFDEHGVTVKTDIAREPVVVQGDQMRLEQIIVNLLRNALDATRASDPRVVTLIVRRAKAGSAQVVVADTGIGLPPGDEEQMFEPFFTTKQAGEGLGLGLALSSSIASELGGMLQAAPRPGGGARFELVLPVAAASGDAAGRETAAGSRSVAEA